MSIVLKKALAFALIAVPLIGGFIIGIFIPPEMTVMAVTVSWALIFLTIGFEALAEEFAGAFGTALVYTVRLVSGTASIGALFAAVDAVLVGAALIAGVTLIL